jgi:4-hydroxy-tetrahydrodipicolinate reductase
MADFKIGIMGVAGRMGRELARAAHAMQGAVVAGGVEQPGSPMIGHDIGELIGAGPLGMKVGDDPLELVARADAILDFTSPRATVEFAGLAANARIVHVIGTTGLGETDEQAIRAAARHATIIKSGNFSPGVLLLAALTRRAAEALDADYDIEILEMHHRNKVDAPSGTALMLGEAAARGRLTPLKDVAVKVRDGHTGARRRGDIGFATLRGGSVFGDHAVIFAADGERLELSHKAADRGVWARNAVKAALWGRGRGPGLHSMLDVLGLA